MLSRDCGAVEPLSEKEIQIGALRDFHAGSTGHLGANELIRRLREAGHAWPSLSRDARAHVRSCVTCQKLKKVPRQPTKSHSTQRYEPFQMVQIDTLGPLPESHSHRYIIVFIDVFTKYTFLIPVPSLEAKYAARAMLQVWSIFGKPLAIQSDNGSQFRNRLVEKVNDIISLSHRFSTSYHPQSNGIIERQNAEITKLLRGMIMDAEEPQDQWSTYLPLVQYVLNTRTPSTTGIAPLALMTGRTSAVDLAPELLARALASLGDERPQDHWLRLVRWRNDAASALRAYDERQRAQGAMDSHEWTSGEYCLLRYPSHPASKLSPCLRGPLMVARPGKSPNTWYLTDLPSGSDILVHAERMIPVVVGDKTREELTSLAARDTTEYVVQEVVSHKVEGKGRQCKLWLKVRWAGYEPSEDSWLRFNKDTDQLEALEAYLAQTPDLRATIDQLKQRWQPRRG